MQEADRQDANLRRGEVALPIPLHVGLALVPAPPVSLDDDLWCREEDIDGARHRADRGERMLPDSVRTDPWTDETHQFSQVMLELRRRQRIAATTVEQPCERPAPATTAPTDAEEHLADLRIAGKPTEVRRVEDHGQPSD